MAEDTRLRDRITGDRLLLATVLLVGIAGTGIVRRQLGVLGYNGLGRLVFVLGYGGTVFVVWYGWIRPLDITGPTENQDVRPSREPGGGRADPTPDADTGSDAHGDRDPEPELDADADADGEANGDAPAAERPADDR